MFYPQEECCTVSLRDVDRAFLMMSWFYKHRQTIFPYMDRWEADQQYNLCLERDSSNDRIPLSVCLSDYHQLIY